MFTRGPGPGVTGGGHLGLECFGQQAAHHLPGLHDRGKQRRRQSFLQCPAQCLLACRARHFFVHDLAANVHQVAVLHTAGAGAFAVAASQAPVQVHLRGARGLGAFQHLLDEVDAAARPVQLVAQQLVGGAGGGAKAAVHALAQDGFGFLAVGAGCVFGGELGLHGACLEITVKVGRVLQQRSRALLGASGLWGLHRARTGWRRPAGGRCGAAAATAAACSGQPTKGAATR